MKLADGLAARFEEEICSVFVHRTASGDCPLTERHECPIFGWAERLAEIVDGVQSDRLADCMDEIGAVICPECRQDDTGGCVDRDHLDCPLDLYLGLVVELFEDELEAGRAGGSVSAN